MSKKPVVKTCLTHFMATCIIASGLSSSHAVFAQSTLAPPAAAQPHAINPADTYLQRQEHDRRIRQEERTSGRQLQSLVDSPVQHPERLPEELPCFPVESVQINTTIAGHDWHKALNGPQGDDSPVGRCLGGAGISLLIARLQNAVLRQGYITSEVLAPEQNLTEGVLTLEVQAGRIGDIRTISENSSVASNIWTLRTGDILKLGALEQSAEHLLRLPGLASRLQIVPGRETGTSDIELHLGKPSPLRLSAGLHDGGNRSTGKLMGTTSLSWDNPLGVADQLNISACTAVGWREDGPRSNRCHALQYSVPVGWWLFSGGISDSHFYQTVFGAFQNYRYGGRSEQAELGAQRVIDRDGSGSTAAVFTLRKRASANFIDDQEIEVQRRRTSLWEASLQHMRQWSDAQLTGRIGMRHGIGAFGALPPPEAAAGESSARMQLLTAQATYAQRWSWLAQTWTHTSDWLSQWNQTPLTPQDRFCIGFRGSLRGLDGQQTACGNRGWQWRNEVATGLNHAFAALTGKAVQAYVAIDMARVSETGFASQLHFSSVAFGLRGAFDPSDSSRLSWDIFAGTPISKPDHFQTASLASGFNLRIDF